MGLVNFFYVCFCGFVSLAIASSNRAGWEQLLWKTTSLLQLWLQPYFQGYPPFNDFPRLYEEVGRLIELLEKPYPPSVPSVRPFPDVDYGHRLLKVAVRVVDEFFNVRNADPWISEAKMFTGSCQKPLKAAL